MIDNEKTKEQLVQELTELRLQNAVLKKSITGSISDEIITEEALLYAESIVETVREPLLVLDADLKIISANSNFYKTFKVTPSETIGSFIYDLGNHQWNIPKLRELLETILPEKTTFENYEVEHDFTTIGKRIMLLNARQIKRALGKEKIILLAIEDITERKEIEAGLEKTRKELEIIKIAADEVREYAESVINTVREPLIALDQDLRVVSASRSFYEFFKVKPEETMGQLIYDLGNHQWNIPKLRELLETILPEKTTFENYEVEHDFTTIGKRIMLLNARQIKRALGKEKIILLAIEDITERKRLETVLMESEERFRRLFETADDAIVLLEKGEGKITNSNPAAEKMLGYTQKECIGHSLQDIGVLPGMDDFQTTLQELNRMGILNYDDVPIKTKTGNHIYTDIYIVDRAKLVQCNIRDITDQKKTSEKLVKSESDMRMLIMKNVDGLIIVDSGGILRFMNPAAEYLFGETSEQLMGKTMGLPLISGEVEEINISAKDGTQRTVEMRTVSINWEEKEAFLISLRDITTGKQAEEKIIEQQNLSNKYLHIAGVMICAINLVGEITLINKRGLDILGYNDVHEVLGKNWFENFLPKNVASEVKLVFDHLMSNNIDQVEYIENSILTKYGEERIIAFHNTMFRNKEDKVTGVLFSGEDITERKQAEDGLQRQLKELQRWHAVTVDREERNLELKREVNGLLKEAGKPAKYGGE